MLRVNNISFSYAKKRLLNNISFQAKLGEHIAIVGESGSGKTTLLKLIYGELDLNKGSIFWKDASILGPKYNLIVGQEYIKYVAQEFDLMPFTSVSENIGKHLSNFNLNKKSKRINELLKIVELEDFENTKVKFLSGGQKQRVALAQALAKAPEIVLLDEPFSHIDNHKKQSLRRNVFNYLKEHHITCIIATHDKEDVLPFSNKMIVLENGEVIATSSPALLYKNPEVATVASFFGEFNIIEPFGVVYANQLSITSKSDLALEVTKNYFMGSIFLIQGQLNDQTIFFEHIEALKPNSIVYLALNK